MIYKYLTQALTAGSIAILAACGGGGESSVDSDAGARNPQEPVVVDPAVEAMSGLWDFTVNFEDSRQDRYYWHFIADGTARAYDFAGDSYDGGSDCHHVYEGSLEAVESDIFMLAIEAEAVYARMAIDGEQLQFDDERLSKVASADVDALTRCGESAVR